MSDDPSFGTRAFSKTDLDNSTPFNPDKRLRGGAAMAFLEEYLGFLAEHEAKSGPRVRARKSDDAERRRRTLDTFLANLVTAAVNREDEDRFIAVSFGNKNHSGPLLSVGVLRDVRDMMINRDLIEGQHGFLTRERAYEEHFEPIGRLTRIRANLELRRQFEELQIGRGSVKRLSVRGVVQIKEPHKDAGPEPDEVTQSRGTIERVNARIAGAKIELPDDAWQSANAGRKERAGEGVKTDHANSGDETAVLLSRIFNQVWTRGGRIYGGWWMNVPKRERQRITIDGEAVTELDYARLHPTLLYNRSGNSLTVDPYGVPGYEGPALRKLAKVTFARLINGSSRKTGSDVVLRRQSGDTTRLPPKTNFGTFFRALVSHLQPVSAWFGRDIGMELQREDSELAVAVLKHMESKGIVTLPIHDSFIVPLRHELELRETMGRVYEERYGSSIEVK